ncbi:hypothetical protein ACFWH1_06870 [Streptomyces sp. NPDC127037]|uniref:hypothetical protein n=1 Tax=Streptomyces sp. NPDC127037 TaxID=3347113 RepID=UPI00364840AE
MGELRLLVVRRSGARPGPAGRAETSRAPWASPHTPRRDVGISVLAALSATARLPRTCSAITRSYAGHARVWSPPARVSSPARTYAPTTARVVLAPTAGPGQ